MSEFKYDVGPTFTCRPTSTTSANLEGAVVILSRLTQEQAELDEVGPMYLVARVTDGQVGHVFEDELTPDQPEDPDIEWHAKRPVTDEEAEAYIDAEDEGWTCPGCGRVIEPSDVRRHASECEKYDGGQGY